MLHECKLHGGIYLWDSPIINALCPVCEEIEKFTFAAEQLEQDIEAIDKYE